MTKIIRYIWIALVGAFAVTNLLFLSLVLITGGQGSLVAFYLTFGHIAWLIAIPLLLVALLARQWRLALLLAPMVLIVIYLYGGRFIGSETDAPVDAITVLSWNIGPRRDEADAVADLIINSNADVVALQEVGPETATVLARDLRAAYPYSSVFDQPGGVAGQAVFSRFPITDEDYWRNTTWPNPLGHQRVSISIGGVDWTLFNVHPSPPLASISSLSFDSRQRDYEIQDTLQRASAYPQPVIIAGDLNLPDTTTPYRSIRDAGYQDTFDERGFGMGWTWPNYPPGSIGLLATIDELVPISLLRLDYIFASPGVIVYRSQTTPSGRSDHHGVLSTIRYRVPSTQSVLDD